MEITTAHASQGLLRRPVRVTQLEPLIGPSKQQTGEDGPLPSSAGGVLLPLNATVFVPRTLRLQPLAAANAADKLPEKRVTLADFAKNAGIGAGLAGVPLSVIPLAKTSTEGQLAALLQSYGFSPGASEQIASSGLGFARTNAGQICCLFMAGSLASVGVVEALKPDWTWKRKLLIGALGGTGLVVLILILFYLGIWGQKPGNRQSVAPSEAAEPLE